MDDRRRLSFGGVAELYDRARPSYPDALVDDVLEFAGVRSGSGSGDRVLEVGAGTGKATLQFAERGLSVVALEPSAEMAAVARRNCASYENVTVVETEFERWRPDGQAFRVVFSAQAWHWVSPDVRYVAARAALEPGGALAVCWNIPEWPVCELRDALGEVYARNGRAGDSADPMNPTTRSEDGVWAAEIASAAGFSGAEVRRYRWEWDYRTEEYLALLGTHSACLVLEESDREQLLSDIAGVIEEHGGSFRMSYMTLLCLARAS
jgi:SAM-dependent methyltransferase